MPQLSFVGLGSMGIEMARRLIAAGHSVRVWNRSESPHFAELLAAGATRARSIDEALDADVAFSMLADDNAVLSCFTTESLRSARRGTIHVNMATISPEAADRLTLLHREAGVGYVAAPVLGRPNVAAEGMLNIVAAGTAVDLDTVKSYFAVLGKRTWVVGEEPKAANLVKIAFNYNLIHTIQALAESITLVEQGGVEASTFVDILTDTSFSGSAYVGYGRLISQKRYEPVAFSVTLGLKDLSLAERAAKDEGVTLLTAPALRDVYERTLADPELATLDWSATAEITRGLVASTESE
jgi:3-hydroxyisobutyrate dehydrogenase-like beta-hydroxyacid dehydrogenase